MRSIINKYNLTAEGIDSISHELEAYLVRLGMTLRNRFRIRLSYEESLLRMRDRFGEDTEVTLTLGRRVGRPFIELSQEGELFNPLSKREVSLEDWSGSLLTSVGLYPQYGYSKGKNYLRLNLPGRRMNPALKVMIGISIGVLAGLFFTNMFNVDAQNTIVDVALSPLYELWIRILLVLSGPVIFIMVMTTVLNTGSIEEEGGSSKKVVARYFLFSSLLAFVSLVFCEIVAGKPLVPEDEIGISASEYLNHIFHLVPKDALSPIIEANTPQILLMAFVLGNGMVLLGSRAERLRALIRQINDLGLLMTNWIGRCVPYITAGLVCYQMMINQTSLLVDLWQVILVALVLSAISLLVVLLMVSAKKRVSVGLLFRKLWSPFITAVRSGGLDRGYGEMEDGTVRQLGIERHFAQVSLPHGIILYMPINVVGTMVLTIYGAVRMDVDMSVGWLLIAGLMSVIMFVATPPVPGANLLAYIMIFNVLNIPDVVLVDAMIFEVLFGIFASAGNQAMLQMDLIVQADHIGLLDKSQLRSDIGKGKE